MLVTLDGDRVQADFAPGVTLALVVERVAAGLPAERRVVAAALNGESLSAAALDDRLAQPLTVGDQIDLESAAPAELVREALHDSAVRVAAAAELHRTAADCLNGGRTVEALGHLREIMGAWQQAQQSIWQGSGLLQRDLTAICYDDQTIAEHIRTLSDRLRAVRDALDAHDLVSLADLTYYEFPELCEHWRGLLSALALEVAGPPEERGDVTA